MIEIREMTNRTAEKLEELKEVWEASARATHRFLTEEEIVRIRGYVPQAMAAAEHLVTAEEQGRAVGFFGTAGTRLEMLFLAPAARGRGLGRRMAQRAIWDYGVREVTVNEQNPGAVGFYEHRGLFPGKKADFFEKPGTQPTVDRIPGKDGGPVTGKTGMLGTEKEGCGMEIPQRIQESRKKKGISQEQLAEVLGVSRQAVSKWESGQAMPELDKVIGMSEYFGVSTDWLLRGVEPAGDRPAGRGKPGREWIAGAAGLVLWTRKQRKKQ